ncbi:hypothetical protein B0H15DRAFT_817059 [Mycena belliarum]|uniref:Uncharacterized protein n=1 Tax=Mycena belliarum TaxID=1033014 RepID=A0AAD6UIY1_9AGAR|nr:hypothetical protein B0H15DRAFT_817059 [Mycena belliae]
MLRICDYLSPISCTSAPTPQYWLATSVAPQRQAQNKTTMRLGCVATGDTYKGDLQIGELHLVHNHNMAAAVWDIVELRRLIFSFGERRDIAVCARVSSTWTEDALDVVWRDLPSPLPLLGILGDDALQGRISGPIDVMDWARFDQYASRVRKLSLPPSRDYHTYLLRKPLSLLVALRPFPPLLPNMSEMCVEGCSAIGFVPQMPRLRTLFLEQFTSQGEQPVIMTKEFFSMLSQRCPGLEELTMVWQTSYMNSVIGIPVLAPLQDCASLAVLDIHAACTLRFNKDADAADLAAILSNLRVCRLTFIPLCGPVDAGLPDLGALLPLAAACRRLEELSLALAATVPDGALRVAPTTRFSPALRTLSVGHGAGAHEWDASRVARFLAGVVPPHCDVVVPPRPRWARHWLDKEDIAEGERQLQEAFELIRVYSGRQSS